MDRRQSTSFLCKKWGLFSFCLIGIVGTIVVAALASTIIDNYVDNNYTHSIYTNRDLDTIKSTAKVLIYVVAVFSILFQLLGLVGSYKEHYCMTLTYTILMTLGSLGSIVNAIKVPTFWVSAVINFVILVLAYSFLYDLRQIRREAYHSSVYVTNQAPTSTHIHIPGPSTVYSGQYEQQYANTNQSYQYQSQYGSGPTQDSWQSPPPPAYKEKVAVP